jgi:hypothetical protein
LPAPPPEKAPPTPRKNPNGVFISDAQQLDAQSADVVVSRTIIISGFMLYDSILEIPNAVASDKKMVKAPYAADTREALLYQRVMGTPALVAKPRVTRCSSPVFVEVKPGRMNVNEPERRTATLGASGSAASA